MSLNFAAISPHPPIIVPGVGKNEDLEKVSNTILAMKKLGTAFTEAEIDTLIIISPHSVIYPDKFNVCGMQKLFGTFASFGQPDIILEAKNDLSFVSSLEEKLKSTEINYLTYDNGGEFFELDHGLMVPLSFINKNAETPFKVVPIAYSMLDKPSHFVFGQTLKEVCKNYPGRVGIIASGDLSHQLIQNPEGKNFDKQIVEDLKEGKVKDILCYDEDYLESVGECGYRSILILLGALDGIEAECEILSYEGPFGVGYLVANYKLEN